MWHLTACQISVSLSFLNWIKNEMIFYRISELMLPTLILRYDEKNHFIFIQFKNAKVTDFHRLSDATCNDRFNTIYQFIKPFLDKNVYF